MVTLTRLEAVQEIFSKEKLDQMLVDLLRSELDSIRRDLAEYRQHLERFERQYGMSSAEANEKFESGELGDAMDYFEWTGIYDLYLRLERKAQQIENSL